MAFDSKGLDDYVDVAKRIAEFRAKHPEGSLQPLNPGQPFEIRELAGTGKDGKEVRGTFIVYIAAAYRSPDDQRPGVGCAYEVFPGRTPYTAGSELQNAETAAWGRAIVAALGGDARAGIASQQEVRNRQAERGDAFEQATPAPSKPQRAQRMAAVPEDDPWYTAQPEPAAEPRARVTRPEAAETDPAWLDLIGKEIDRIKSRADGEKVWAKIVAAFNDHTCTPADRKALEGMVGAKVAAALNQAEATKGEAA